MKTPKLNPSLQQLGFYDWVRSGSGSCILEAVAGAGKTTTLIHALGMMMGTKFFGAFNKKIADEIAARAGMQMGLTVSTMHAAGMRAWKKVADKYVKVEGSKVRDIFRAEVGRINPMHMIFEGPVVQLVSLAKQSGIGITCETHFAPAWDEIILHHNIEVFDERTGQDNYATILEIAMHVFDVSLKTCMKIIDYDDMIFAPLYFDVKFDQYDWVLIDEAQDTNAVRRMMALHMLAPGGRLVAVGDRHQAIYGFTGADSDALDLIGNAVSAIKLPLTITFRCPKKVVEYAQRWVKHIEADKTAPEGSVRTSVIEKLVEEARVGDAVLCRFNAPLIKHVYAFIAKGIPARVEGREIGGGLKLLANRFKAATMDQLTTKLTAYYEREMAKMEVKENHKGMENLTDKFECLKIIIERVTLKGLVTKPPQTAIIAEIDEIFGANADEAKPVVLFSSIHKAKGREWMRVIWLTTGPSPFAKMDWEKQQEDNLCYVAVSRSMDELIMIEVPRSPMTKKQFSNVLDSMEPK